MRAAVLGAGITGAVIARQLAQRGDDVVLFESSPAVGGLVASHSVGGTPIEIFYHHVFTHEIEILDLILELGLHDSLEWLPSTVAILNEGGALYPFTSPRDLLSYDRMPLFDRIRMGAVGVLAPYLSNWRHLDDMSAYDWVRKRMGSAALNAIWDPMLRVKWGEVYREVPAAWLWARLSQRARSRGDGGRGERLGYIRGGFKRLYDALASDLVDLGVDLRLNTPIEAIKISGNRVRSVASGAGDEMFDQVISTLPIPVFADLAAGLPPAYENRLRSQEYMWVICILLTMNRSSTPYYWVNIADRSIPFGAYIEHTNLLPRADYGGHALAYLGRYFAPPRYSDEARQLAEGDLDEIAAQWIPHLKKLDPAFDPSQIESILPARTQYAAPLVRLGHGQRRLPFHTPIDGLWIATMAQIYPDDRGQSEGVRLGYNAVRAIGA